MIIVINVYFSMYVTRGSIDTTASCVVNRWLTREFFLAEKILHSREGNATRYLSRRLWCGECKRSSTRRATGDEARRRSGPIKRCAQRRAFIPRSNTSPINSSSLETARVRAPVPPELRLSFILFAYSKLT